MSRRGAILLAALLAGCGLTSKDISVSQDFQAGGGPGSGTQFNASSITTPLSASAGELSKLSSVTLASATLESTDGKDLAFVTGGSITISGNGLPQATLATLAAPGAVGLAQFAVTATDLKPYLAAGGTLDAQVTYPQPPVPARGLKLTLVVHASL